MVDTYLCLGSNLGDRNGHLAMARDQIHRLAGEIVDISNVYETEGWETGPAPMYLNQCLCLRTSLPPAQLLEKLLDIERELGRERSGARNENRVIDLDILLYGSQIVNEEGLHIPHRHMTERRFVLQPLSEIASKVMHPVLGKSVGELLIACDDRLLVKKFGPSFR